MEQYTILCTEEQTKKALELGVPIDTRWDYDDGNLTPFEEEISIGFRHYAKCPTVEQMLGWLEEQGFLYINIMYFVIEDSWNYYGVTNVGNNSIGYNMIGYNSRKEATIAAIDAALDYLINNKK